MRRLLLVSAAVLLLSAYPFRVRAFDQAVEVEASPYGGSASGQFPRSDAAGCAAWAPPAARVRYGGVGVSLRVRDAAHAIVPTPSSPEASPLASPRAAEQPVAEPDASRWTRRGFIFQASAALERQSYHSLAPASGEVQLSPNAPSTMFSATNVPGPLFRGALGLRFGNDWKNFGVSAGALAMTHVGAVNVNACTASTGAQTACVSYPDALSVFPDLQARIGPFYPFYVELGLGSYNMTTLARPGIYAGAIAGTDSGWELALHYGVHSNFQAPFTDLQWGHRGDFGVKVPLARAIRLGANAALYEGFDRHVEYSGALSVEIGVGSMASP